MKIVAGMLALTALSALVACRDDDRASSTKTTSHVMIPDPTAVDQSNDPVDLALVGDVRRALVLDNRIGLGAKNVVLVVRDGVVTMRGDVSSTAEHERIVAKVVSVPGVVRIDDRIAVEGVEGASQ